MSKIASKLGINLVCELSINLGRKLERQLSRPLSRKLDIDLKSKFVIELSDKLTKEKITQWSFLKGLRITNPRVQHVLRFQPPPFCPTAGQSVQRIPAWRSRQLRASPKVSAAAWSSETTED
jgi:hypothetical protein